MRYPRYYAGQGHIHNEQNSPPFIYTGPRLQSASGSRKAKKVLGLVAQFERRSIEEEERGGPIKAQRTLGLVTDLPRDRRSWRKSGSGEFKGEFEQKLAQAEKEIRRLSRMQHLAVDTNDEEGAAADDEQSDDEKEHDKTPQLAEEDDEEASQPDPEKVPFLELPISQSPQQLSFPRAPIELDAGPDHELLLPPRRPRARPHSYTSPRFSDRPKNKIASSRSRGLSSPPNFSRPLSSFTPKPIPGEHMERDPLSIRFSDIEDDPRSPMSPIGGTFVSNEIKAALEKLELGISKSRTNSPMPTSPPPPAKRASKPRWSSLPVSLMKLAHKRKSSKDDDALHLHLERKDTKQVVTLTEENLQRWEDEVGYVPKMYRLGYDLLKSPASPDMHVERCTPVPRSKTPSPRPDALALARAQAQMLTPPVSPPLHLSSAGSTVAAYASPSLPTPTLSPRSFTPTAVPSFQTFRSSTTSTLLRAFPSPPACYAPPTPSCTQHAPSLAQKEALATPQLTCVLCGETEHPSAFPAQGLGAGCVHAGRVCRECVAGMIGEAVGRGEGVRCPECDVALGREEVRRVYGGW
ncbi:hypothetical protein SLS60_005066 [Paraconiothyrium brasiliense]|uniref:RING-type domain-containing protein n=1 Tax=Paraconiothyrium brasiliense TaxID=300254 RepID=A0ABR3RH54_9PLEO